MTAGFAHELRVYWEDTDAGGVVYHANYLRFFERARSEWLRAAGFGQQALRDRFDCLFVVAELSLRHLAPARLDDRLRIGVMPESPRGASWVLRQSAARIDAPDKETPLAQAQVTLACVHAHTLRPRRIPAPILEALNTP